MIGAIRLLAPSTFPGIGLVGGGPADSLARALRPKLPSGYAVAVRYRPTDTPRDRVPLVVVGPGAVIVVEPRRERGRVISEEDTWWVAAPGDRTARRMEDSPSRRARWHATRITSDVQCGGFVRVRVEPAVFFGRARLADRANSTLAAFDALEDLVTFITRLGSADRAPDRTLALAHRLGAR
ncbi:MAG TPA: nuclease-related domain-containing protein [Candidatus Limnocylindria bacterium]|nr:nuclease-related domain-containing protein [Candidatus Limnocylindria bacterium]